MTLITRILAALTLALAFGSVAQAQVKISNLPVAPPPAGSPVAPVVQGGTTYQAGAQWWQAFLGVPRVVSLDYYAKQAGVTLCTGDGHSDDSAFSLAEAAETAAGAGAGLIVYLPPCLSPGYQTTGFTYANRGGYVAWPGTVVINQIRGSSSSAATTTVSADNAFDTGFILYGFTLNGGWSWARSPYSGSPSTDPWLDQETGLSVNLSPAGVNDAQFHTNSPVGAYLPYGRVAQVFVANYGGNCFTLTGNGTQAYEGLHANNCGGYGIDLNSYDNQISAIDIGNTGRSAVKYDVYGSDNHLSGKLWFCGFRQISGDASCIKAVSSALQNNWNGILQDAYCDVINDAGNGNWFQGQANWAGVLNASVCSGAAIYKAAGSTAPAVDLNINGEGYANVAYLVNDSANNLTRGRFDFVAQGMPSDTAGWHAAWLTGTVDHTNYVRVNNNLRSVLDWAVDPASGQVNFAGPDSTGGKCGSVVDYTNGVFDLVGCGVLGGQLIAQNNGSYGPSTVAWDYLGHLCFYAACTKVAQPSGSGQSAYTATVSQTAGASYTANEQAMLAALKADVLALTTEVNALRTALVGVNLIKGGP